MQNIIGGLKHYILLIFRSSHRRCSVRKGVLRNFSKFTGKELPQAHLFYRTPLGGCFCILLLCSEITFSKNSYHTERSQAISKENKLSGFYMIQVFTKRYFQTDCILYLKILYLAPGSSKEFYANTGFFVQSQSYHLQLSVILFKCVTFFAVFHPWIFHFADSRNYSYKEVDNKSQNYRQSNNSMLKLWFLLSFLLQIILK